MVDSSPLHFSHREAVLLTSVSDEALHSWVKRGYVQPAVSSTGRGKRRAYDQLNLVQIQVLRTFSEAGLDPSLSILIFERLQPLAAELIQRFSSEAVPVEPALHSESGALDRHYRTWLIDRLGCVVAEFTDEGDSLLKADRPVKHLPITAMWLQVDILLNEWVLVPIEYHQAGRPQTEGAYFDWLRDRCDVFDQGAPTEAGQ